MNRGLKFRRIAAAFNDGNYTQAAAFATDAQAQHPDDLRFPRLRARAIFEGGDPARAVTILEPTAKANPRDTATQLALADLYNDAGRDGDAERTLRQLLDVEPANAEALNYLGYLLANRGRSLDEAVRLVERALVGGAGQSGVSRQPGLGALPPRQPGRGREVSVAGRGAAAAQRRRAGSPGRRARPARPVGRCHHRLDARARGRRRHRPRAGRKEDSGRQDEDTALRMINSQLPTPNSQRVGRPRLGFGARLGFGSWVVGMLLRSPRLCSRGSCRCLTDPGAPLPDFAEIHRQASAACSGVRTLTAELALSGRAGGRAVRGRAIVGFERPASIRLEGVAPFGPPAFVLAGSGATATLLLPRDNRVLRNARAEDILGALTGVALSPADLLAVLTGCVTAMPVAAAGRLHQNGWASIDLAGDATVFLERVALGWQPRAARRPGWQIEYPAWQGAFPATVRLRVARPEGRRRPDRGRLAARDEHDASIRAAFTVTVPDDMLSMTLDELATLARCERSGPCMQVATHDVRSPTSTAAVTIRAHAKINLDLRVLGTRRDGFHELRTVFQAIALHDTIECLPREGPFAIECNVAGVPLDETNLIWRAAQALWRALRRDGAVSGCARAPGQTDSRCRAGLAAAAPMRRRRWSRSRARGACRCGRRSSPTSPASLGADVPFFLAGGTALGLGRGDEIYPLADLPRHWIVLLLPGFGVSSREAYEWYDQERDLARGPASARAAAGAGSLALARGADDQRPRGADRAAPSGDRSDEGGAAPRRRARGGDVGQRIRGVRPVSEAPRCAFGGRSPVRLRVARAADRIAGARRLRAQQPAVTVPRLAGIGLGADARVM